MSKALAIAARELNGRRSIFLTAAVLAIVPYAVLLIPEVQRFGRATAVAMTGIFVAICYISGLAFVLGATFVGRELVDKRISFYFSKPVSERAIWFGKLAGSLATLVACMAIIIVPVLLGSGEEAPRLVSGLGYFGLAALTLFLVSHAVATMLRSRSALILADAVAIAIAGTLAYVMVHVLMNGLAVKLVDRLLWALTIASLGILIAAGAWQLSRGRTDVRANHRELSRFLWSATAVMLLLAGAAVLWVARVTPDDLQTRVFVDQVPNTDWVVMTGMARNRGDYHAAFFKNVATGKYQRIDASEMWWGGFFTRDGRHGGQVLRTRELQLLTMGAEGVKITPTRVTASYPATLVPSDDMSRLAIVTPGMITVEGIAEERTLAAARPPAGYVCGFFVTPDLLRLYLIDRRQTDIYELDVRAKKLAKSGTFSTAGRLSFTASPDGSRLLVHSSTSEGDELLLLDGRTGARIGSLGVQEKGTFGAILSDGRVATVNVRAAKKLAIYSPDLVLQRQVELPGIPYIWLLRELEGGRIVLGGSSDRLADRRDWTVRIIDANSGATVRNERVLRPLKIEMFGNPEADPRRDVMRAGAPLIVVDSNHRMKRITL